MSSMKQGGACGVTAGCCEGEKLSVIGDICMNFCLIRSLNTQPHNLFVTHSAKEGTTNSHQDKREFSNNSDDSNGSTKKRRKGVVANYYGVGSNEKGKEETVSSSPSSPSSIPLQDSMNQRNISSDRFDSTHTSLSLVSSIMIYYSYE